MRGLSTAMILPVLQAANGLPQPLSISMQSKLQRFNKKPHKILETRRIIPLHCKLHSPLHLSKNLQNQFNYARLRSYLIAQSVFLSYQLPLWKWVDLAFGEEVAETQGKALEVPIPVDPPVEVESKLISVLLTLAFVVLAILTIGIIYLAVSDFRENRQRKEIAKQVEKKKDTPNKKTKKPKMAKTGPRGFGQKKKEDADDEL